MPEEEPFKVDAVVHDSNSRPPDIKSFSTDYTKVVKGHDGQEENGIKETISGNTQ